MFSVKKVPPTTKCSSCDTLIEYGIRVKEKHVFCNNECLAKCFSIKDLVNMYKTNK